MKVRRMRDAKNEKYTHRGLTWALLGVETFLNPDLHSFPSSVKPS